MNGDIFKLAWNAGAVNLRFAGNTDERKDRPGWLCLHDFTVSNPLYKHNPIMIGFMEWTCRNAVLPLLEPGYDTVGTHVNVAHLGASPIGMAVTFTAEVIRVDGRRIEFRVEARDEKEKIGEGTHERAIINIAKFATRLAEKKRLTFCPSHCAAKPWWGML